MQRSQLSSYIIIVLHLSVLLPLVLGKPGLTENIPKIKSDALLKKRSCDNPCGWDGTTCCSSGETCYTDANNQAQCGVGGQAGAAVTGAASSDNSGGSDGNGHWTYYTSTFVESGLVTRTKVFSEFIAGSHPTPEVTPLAAPPSTEEPACQYALNESPCGHICCQSGSYCLNPDTGHCANAGAGSSGHLSSFLDHQSITASAPLRPTASTFVVVTATGTPTTTVPFEAPLATGANVTVTSSTADSDGGLSAGAIAGIVIGVIFGIILLALLCFFCCLKGAANRLLAIFGLGRRRRRREEYVEEYHRHSHHGGHGRTNGQWYGQARPSRPSKKKKKAGGLGGFGTAAAGLGTLGLLLGLKRKNDRRTEKSDYTSSTGYYSSDYTSSSSSSSADRSRDTRRSSRR